jgi:arylsulfatase
VSDLNVLLITTDQQRWDSLPSYGRPWVRAPNIERLAREGVVFEQCYTPSPVCVPARACLIGGQWPSTTGVLGNNHGLPDDFPTWPKLLSAAGVRTAAIGKMHFYPWDARNGFEERVSAEDKRHTYLPDDFVKFLRQHGHERVHPTANPGYFESLGAPVTPLERRFHVDGFIGDQAAAWIERNGPQRFAAWVSFAGPHDPYDPPEEMASLYEGAPVPEPIGSRAELETKPRAQRVAGQEALANSMFRIDPTRATREQVMRWRRHYFANISLIDEGVGKILAALEASGQLERTLIVFSSDHGDALGDHGLPYKSFFYDSMARVPLIARGPGVAAGGRCRSLVSLLDLVPTIYAAAGVPPPPTLEGRDLTPLLADPAGAVRDLVFSEIVGRAMVRDERFKYAHYVEGDAELYDLVADPTEERNLAADPAYAAEVARMRGRLVEHALRTFPQRAARVERPQEPARLRLEDAYGRERAGPG